MNVTAIVINGIAIAGLLVAFIKNDTGQPYEVNIIPIVPSIKVPKSSRKNGFNTWIKDAIKND